MASATSAPSATTDAPTDSATVGGETETEGSSEPVWAHGIRLDRVTANQAVQVELVVEGMAIPVAEQNTRLIEGRRTLVRGFWSLHADFEPRDILGRLTINYPDGESIEQDFIQTVEGESSDGAGTTSFQWLLEPDQVVTGMTFRARLFEMPDAEPSGDISDPPPVAPLAGEGTLDLYVAPLEIKVVLVPVLHQFEGCEAMPDIQQEDIDAMRMEIEQLNPIQRAIITVREPMPYTASIQDGPAFSPVLAALAQARAADVPDPNAYYYGLIEPCDGYPPGLLGQAIAIPTEFTMNNGNTRISAGRWSGSGAAAAETFVHEVGHSQGRRHVRCSGGEAGIDAAYPHDGGRIGVWGFGIYDFQLRTPSGARDYMSYCSNEWVSDYTWEQTLDVIEVLTSWDYADVQPPPSTAILAGLLHDDGTADWWTVQGDVPHPDAQPSETMELELDGARVTLPASVRPVPHSRNAKYVEVALPQGFHLATSARLSLSDRQVNVELAQVARFD